jgi:hypothetical protein
MDNFMKIRIFLGLCVVLGVSPVSAQASDNPAQAAARAALEQKLSQPDAWEPQPLTPMTTPSVIVVQQPVKSAASTTANIAAHTAASTTARTAVSPVASATVSTAASTTRTVSEKAVTPQTTLASTTPIAAPTVADHAGVAPYSHTLILIMSFLVLLCLALSFMLLKLTRLNSRSNHRQPGQMI